MAGAGGPADALLAEGRRRYEAGDFADAEPLARRALELLPEADDRLARAVAVQLLGECAYSLGRYREAAALADEAAALRADAPDVDRAETENLRGIVALSLGDAAAGHERVAAAYRIREAALGPEDPDTIEALNNTGVALDGLGRTDEAIEAHEEALRRCERAFAEPHLQLAVSLNALAVKLDRDATTRPRVAALYDRALSAAEGALGPEHPMVATMLANVATGRLNAGDVDAARPLVARSVALHKRRYGPTHPNTATALLTASALALMDGRLEEARDMADRVATIRLEAFGIADQRTRKAIVQLVAVFGAMLVADPATQGGDAVALFGVHRALAATPLVIDNVRLGAADPERAERELRAYLARAADRRPPEDAVVRRELDRARAAALAADRALMAGDPATAAVAAGEAITRLEAARGPGHLDLVEPLHRAAAVERTRGEGRRAIELDRRAFGILGTAYGDRHPYVLLALARLVVAGRVLDGPSGGREDLMRLRHALAEADPGGFAAHLLGVVDRGLASMDAQGDGRRGIDDPGSSPTRRRPD